MVKGCKTPDPALSAGSTEKREAAAASIDLDGELIAGSLPRRALTLVAEWARLHREELEANWERARREEPLQAIAPLP
ncbi:MAG: DUF4160 domain-containing protein [Thermoleophilaceae bacterium]